ncbi:hypothetical protein E3J38_01655 [candidate division TA06 bacterium]|uniref:Uncharacterized protein n=1 Tax=candidate division TA06 bacterium TaxID=2250710 RepID=A0A523XTX1_UNCT6|nr:MAG: hypothetical protein E3J38_01655 [candidate division TA06 bacterium]
MKPAVSWKQAYNLRLTGYDFVIWLVDNIARDETDDFLVEAISQNLWNITVPSVLNPQTLFRLLGLGPDKRSMPIKRSDII